MNQSELEALFREHHARLLAEARAMLYDDEEAQDVVSELFVGLLNRMPEVEAGRESAYLSESVRNRCRNVLARKTLTERVTHLYALEQQTTTNEEETERLDRLEAFIRREGSGRRIASVTVGGKPLKGWFVPHAPLAKGAEVIIRTEE